MMTSVSQTNPNKRQVLGKHRAARTSSRGSKKGGFVIITSTTMPNLLVLLVFMFLVLAVSPTSSLAESTNDALEIGDTHAILEQSKVSSLFGFSDNVMLGD
jgi:hypothetical protein